VQVLAGQSSVPPSPTISGTPATTDVAGGAYAFQPSATGPSGATLSFSVTNLPSWANFSTATGLLSGTPTAGNVGSYPGIVMSVSDGSASASLPAFAITVTAAAAAANPTVSLSASPASISSGSSATLNWSSTNATSCSASGGWSGAMATSGSMSTGALSSSTTYTLTCSGAGGTTPASASTTVSVQSGTTGGVSRPSYNTGYGLFVLNGKLYDSKGIEFRIRGVNLCHYDSTQYSGPGIARSNANTVRVGLYLSSISTSTYVNTLQTYISDSENVVATMFYVPGTRNVTSGDQSTADLASVVQNWVTNYQYYAPLQQHLIIDVANEWGPQNSATWESAYISAIASLRAAGYTAPIMIDTGAWGQDTGDLLNYAQAVFNSDPQKNVIFSLHVYAGLGDGWSVASLNAYALQLQSLAASAGMVFVFGEFGPGADIGPSPTMLTPQQVIGAAEAAGIGWMGWAWDDNNLSDGAASNNSFSMTFNGPGIYTVPSDLTTYGQEMVLSNYALALAKKATDF
jgi:Cellulase (glycosyl hydrolase family 5)/Putative Ig domain